MTHPIVTAARGWIGTRFHHQGRLRKTGNHKGGVDCLGLLVGIAGELHLKTPNGLPLTLFDEIDYSHQPDTAWLKKRLSQLLMHIPVGGISPGDIVLLNIDDNPQHLAVISDRQSGLGLIHAYAPARAVVEHPLDGWWQEKIAVAFRVSSCCQQLSSAWAPA